MKSQATVTNNAIDWLLEGDAAIRWQTMRDLQDTSASQWQAERRSTTDETLNDE